MTSIMTAYVVDSSNPSSILTVIREYVTHFLPPPLVALIKRIDSDNTYADILGQEPAIKIFMASLALIIMMNILFAISRVRVHSKRKRHHAIVDHDSTFEDSVLSASCMGISQDKYGDSVILIGPSQSGKTFLFHKLLLTSDDEGRDSTEMVPQSVVSLRANIAILSKDPLQTTSSLGIRLIDYPGHVQLLSQLASLLQPEKMNTTRILLVIDSTKSVHEAANLIYRCLFSDPNLLKAWQKRYHSDENDVLKVLVVCNRANDKDAKNWRRIKLQLKAELDHLHKLKQTAESNIERGIDPNVSVGNVTGKPSSEQTISSILGETVNLDALGTNIPLEFHFVSISGSSSEEPSFKAVVAFVLNGEVLEKNTPVIKQK